MLHAQGQYVCFVDPDDNIGPHFVESFMREMTEQYDFIAMGFFKMTTGFIRRALWLEMLFMLAKRLMA